MPAPESRPPLRPAPLPTGPPPTIALPPEPRPPPQADPAVSTIPASISASALAHLTSSLQRLRQGNLVGVFEVASDGEPPGDAREPHAQRAEQPGQIERGGLALDVRVGGEDHLAHGPALQPQQELAHLEIVRPDAVERRERAE